MSLKNDPDLLSFALQGYEGKPFDGLETSTTWYAWKAGGALARTGRTAPAKCAASRGTSIRIETAGQTEFKIQFDRKTNQVSSISRINV